MAPEHERDTRGLPRDGERPTALARALRAVIGREMWHGPALESALEGVDAETAASHPLPGAHSIWELVVHLGQWAWIVEERLRGRATAVTPDVDFPPIEDFGEEAWAEAVASTRQRYLALAEAVADLDAEALQGEGVDGDTSLELQIRGVIEHGAYHTGQIMLLRRAAGLA